MMMLCRVMPGHMGAIHCVKCSPCGRYIASAGDDLAVLVWDIASGRVCRVFKGHRKPVHSVDFSTCGRFLASASADGTGLPLSLPPPSLLLRRVARYASS